MKNQNLHEKLLCAFVSNDVTRFNFSGVFHDSKMKMAVATDGHRLFATPKLYCENLKDKLVDPKDSKRVIEAEFPDVTPVIPKDQKESVEVFIPDWLAFLKKSVCSVPVSMDCMGRLHLDYVENAVIHFNLAYLKELAGKRVTISYTKELSAFTVKHADLENCILIVMPINRGVQK